MGDIEYDKKIGTYTDGTYAYDEEEQIYGKIKDGKVVPLSKKEGERLESETDVTIVKLKTQKEVDKLWKEVTESYEEGCEEGDTEEEIEGESEEEKDDESEKGEDDIEDNEEEIEGEEEEEEALLDDE